MPREKQEPVGLDMGPAAYRYSPGDGHTYQWDGVGEYATVYRHTYPYTDPARLVLVDTREAVYMAGCARTATAFMDHVDRWRTSRPVGVAS